MKTAIAWRRSPRPAAADIRITCLALLAGVIWLLATPGLAYACKCVEPGSPSEELAKFDAVFAGRVVHVDHSFDLDADSYSPEDRTTVGFAVSTVWKGAVAEEMFITTPPPGGSCGFGFVEGAEYIVYGYASDFGDGGYSTGICSRTALLEQAQTDLDELGTGRPPEPGTGGPVPDRPSDTIAPWTWWFVAATAAAAVAAVGVAAYPGLRRREPGA